MSKSGAERFLNVRSASSDINGSSALSGERGAFLVAGRAELDVRGCAALFEAIRGEEIAAQNGVPGHCECQGVGGGGRLQLVQSDQHLRTAQQEDDVAGENVSGPVGDATFSLAAGN